MPYSFAFCSRGLYLPFGGARVAACCDFAASPAALQHTYSTSAFLHDTSCSPYASGSQRLFAVLLYRDNFVRTLLTTYRGAAPLTCYAVDAVYLRRHHTNLLPSRDAIYARYTYARAMFNSWFAGRTPAAYHGAHHVSYTWDTRLAVPRASTRRVTAGRIRPSDRKMA